MGFEWDAAKEAANLRKHGITFRQAAEIFRGLVLVAEDTRRDYGEERLIAVGEYDGEIIRVVFTHRQQNIRIISAWKAGSHERKAYEKARQGR
jgi:uncharacterized DUF497 family protein